MAGLLDGWIDVVEGARVHKDFRVHRAGTFDLLESSLGIIL